ncbi:hypothetical protein KLP28_06125 [Nocardioidaceae bacterium]|nr:hypothetical protein KLP28_06125 [Nocardioidaceae bacterium]
MADDVTGSPERPGGRRGDRLSRAEINKDAVQDAVTATTGAVGDVMGIVVKAVGDVARSVGGLATDLFEIRDASRRAKDDCGEDPRGK